MTDHGVAKLPVVGDCGYGDATEFRLGLDQRGLTYVLEVDPTASAHPMTPYPSRRATEGGTAHRRPGTGTSCPTCATWPWPPAATPVGRSPGAPAPSQPRPTRAPKYARGSSPSASAPPTPTSPATPTATSPRCGCSPNGPRRNPSQPSTGCPTWTPSLRSKPWSG